MGLSGQDWAFAVDASRVGNATKVVAVWSSFRRVSADVAGIEAAVKFFIFVSSVVNFYRSQAGR
jgi:hypothetical protein